MQLIDWLKANRVTMEAFAAQIGRTQSIVSRVANKKHYPPRNTAVAIVAATGGQTTLDEMFDVPRKYRRGS